MESSGFRNKQTIQFFRSRQVSIVPRFCLRELSLRRVRGKTANDVLCCLYSQNIIKMVISLRMERAVKEEGYSDYVGVDETIILIITLI